MNLPRTETKAASGRDAAPTVGLPGGQLGPTERLFLLMEIVLAYARARRTLSRAPIESVVAKLRSRYPVSSSSTVATLEEAHRMGWAVTRTLAFMPGDTRCLIQSLVLTRLLARRGIPVTLVIGVRTDPGFLAHAWVEHAGEPILTPGDESFGRLVEL
jgi:hypothetical protein